MQQAAQAAPLKADRTIVQEAPASAHEPVSMDREEIRDLMWRAAGLFRTHERLIEAVAALGSGLAAAHDVAAHGASHDADAWRLRNLATVALLVARAALRRQESRGGHYRADFPRRDDLHFRVHIVEQAG